MSVAGLSGAGLTWEHNGERAGTFRSGLVWGSTCGETLKRGLDCGQVVEVEEAVGTAAELAGGLRAAQHEEAKDGGLVAAKVEDGSDTMLVLRDAGVADRCCQGEVFESVEGLADVFFGEFEDRVAA
jgi:hypothetical protein